MAQREASESGIRLGAVRLIKPLRRLLRRVHAAGTERDRAGNRTFFYDHYLSLLLLYFANPALESMRAVQQATNWERVRKQLKIPRVSSGSLSESVAVFDPALVRPILKELAATARPHLPQREAAVLEHLTAVDGSVFDALPRMAWALWMGDRQRGLKLHLHFQVAAGVPRDAIVTPAACSEPAVMKTMLERDRLYVVDRGYASFELFRAVLDAGSSLVARVKDDLAVHVDEERVVSQTAAAAGVVRDVVLKRLGTAHHKDVVGRPMRLVVVRSPGRNGKTNELWLVTDRLDLDADLVALAYRHRWTVELFFRWLKCILGARHLVSHHHNGVALQLYAALIVSLLIAVRTGRKPTRRTFELVQFYLLGWVSDREFDEHLTKLGPAEKSAS